MLTFEESKELGEFADTESGEIADDIVARYNLTTPEGIKSALRYAAYVGFCIGKGYDK